MNKIVSLVTLIASATIITNVAAVSINNDLAFNKMSVPFDWMLKKNLVDLSPEQRRMIQEEGTFSGQINVDYTAVAQNLAQDGNAYLASNNPVESQTLATNLLRYLKLFLISARFNKNNEAVINQVMDLARPYLTTHQDALLARARLNKHGDLAQLLATKR